MRNPFTHHGDRHEPNSPSGGAPWGARVERRVTRAHGDPLYLQFRMPDGITLRDVAALVPAARDLPAWLADGVVALDQVQASQATVVVGGICAEQTPDDILATVTVVYSEDITDPAHALKEGSTRADRPGEKAIVEVTHLRQGSTLVNRTSMISLTEGAEPIPMVTVTFLRKSKLGGLALSFCSTHSGGGSRQMTDFYADVFGTLYLGESEPSSGWG